MNKILFDQDVQLLSPCFCRGAYPDKPEIRPASIRGQLAWWFRAFGFSDALGKDIFGGVGKPPMASRIVVRVLDCRGGTQSFGILPHKQGMSGSAFNPSSMFRMIINTRRDGLLKSQEEALNKTLTAWLYFGGLGLRSNRAAGSVWLQGTTREAFDRFVLELPSQNIVPCVLEATYSSVDSARKDASDTIGGRDDRSGDNELRSLAYPLGAINPRKPSPLKLKIVQFAEDLNQFRLVAVWDGRNDRIENLLEAARWMTQKNPPKPLGQLLLDAFS
ncbi:MAG: RAMP superfamily CRISPR-associated protein [Lentisphaerota bacterium]